MKIKEQKHKSKTREGDITTKFMTKYTNTTI